jgi:2-polyprenyl-3-methyl-5-hydroxy-6-metoxy-1,4-benzoquinol methylase
MNRIFPTRDELTNLFERHQGAIESHGWQVRLRDRFGYFPSARWYEGILDRLVTSETTWLDVGGGKTIIPTNPALAKELVLRSKKTVGVDPSENIHANNVVHERHQAFVEDFQTKQSFDLITLRMVAEHVSDPDACIAALSRLISPGGYLVVLTPNRWSPVSLAASLIPNRFHSLFVGILDGRDGGDVFPTYYLLNTRKSLRKCLSKGGFKELEFRYLDNCSLFYRYSVLSHCELRFGYLLRRLGLQYPENELLGVYEKVSNEPLV